MITEAVPVPAGRWLLRPWRPDAPEDRAALLVAVVDPEIAIWNPIVAPPQGPWAVLLAAEDPRVADEAAQAWCARQSDWSAGTGMAWAITAVDDDAAFGYVSVHQIDADQGTAQTGYWLLPAARRRGATSTALAAAARFCFTAVGLHRLELFHAVDNAASCRTAERAGFRQEGLHRQSHRFGDGAYHDEHTHGRLAADPDPVLAP